MGEAVSFDESGVRVIRGAVDSELCESVRRSLARWARRHPHPGEKYQDAWMRHRPVRELACHPRILAELEDIYGRRPIPFQTLNMARGTQQPLHADSIHFDSLPRGWMCGVWVALEEVGRDQGPLRFAPGSHWITPSVFSELAVSASDIFDMAAYERSVSKVLLDSPVADFEARTGDVLIWHADLAHGGAMVRDRESTRWSQVTHYFFEGSAYVSPMLCDMASGSLYLKDPVVDISTGRRLQHIVEGRPAHWLRLSRGQVKLATGGSEVHDLKARFGSSLSRGINSSVYAARRAFYRLAELSTKCSPFS